jgi:hypothetical protein
LELAIEILSTEYPRLNAMWEQLKAEQSLYWQVRIPACPTHSSLWDYVRVGGLDGK